MTYDFLNCLNKVKWLWFGYVKEMILHWTKLHLLLKSLKYINFLN